MLTTSARAVLPHLLPECISWRRVGPFLEVQFDLVNASHERSEEDELVIEAAPLGAFVPFEPAGRVLVAAFEPFERRRIRTTVTVPAFDATSAAGGRLVSALGEPVFNHGDFQRFLKLMRSGQWAGNLNVYFDRAPESAVELHRAYDLKVETHRPVMFSFLLGEECALAPRPSDPAWGAEVLVPTPGHGVVTVHPPAEVGARATIEVRATRTADGKTVLVEFGLETVSGRGESIGCVKV
jgi:hypothetical protein